MDFHDATTTLDDPLGFMNREVDECDASVQEARRKYDKTVQKVQRRKRRLLKSMRNRGLSHIYLHDRAKNIAGMRDEATKRQSFDRLLHDVLEAIASKVEPNSEIAMLVGVGQRALPDTSDLEVNYEDEIDS